jgi:CRP/FNR family transcriptional regulator
LLVVCKNEIEAYYRYANKAQKQAKGRIADVLLMFADEIFQRDIFPVLLSQEEIANMVDTSRESVSRVLTEFAKDGIITVTGKQIEIINRKLLLLISVNG